MYKDKNTEKLIDISNWIFTVAMRQKEAMYNKQYDAFERTSQALITLHKEIALLLMDEDRLSDSTFRANLMGDILGDQSSDELIESCLKNIEAKNLGCYYDLFEKPRPSSQ